MSKAKTPSILVVDDTPENLNVLKNILTAEHYEVRPLPSGGLALRAAKAEIPDLILLDIMMPGMNGYEVCEQLKADPLTRDVPVIFISALQETEDKVRAFSAGGVDYVSKPFQAEEVLARVFTHIQLARTRSELQDSKQQLEEQNAKLTQLNQEKNEFLGIAAHDLKNPLAGIRGMAQLIKAKVGADTPRNMPVRNYADAIEANAQKMFTLITNLLDVNAIESGKLAVNLEAVECAELLQGVTEAYRLSAAAKKIRIQLAIPRQPPAILSHADTLQQILDNLISNAVKYSPLDSQIHISLHIEPDTLQIRIQDQGPGFTEADKAKLFGKFTRLSAQPTGGEHSTGLGLFIVKKLVDALNGKVWSESEAGQGACFILELPMVLAEQSEIDPNLRILLAEDNLFNQKIALINLKKLGLQADIVSSGEEVLVALSQKTYDVVLMDIQMPGMDGLQASAAIHQQYSAQQRPRIIAVTANATERENCLKAGMDGYLLKPFTADNLALALMDIL